MKLSWHGDDFRITGLLWWESTGPRWIPVLIGWVHLEHLFFSCVSLLDNLLNEARCWWFRSFFMQRYCVELVWKQTSTSICQEALSDHLQYVLLTNICKVAKPRVSIRDGTHDNYLLDNNYCSDVFWDLLVLFCLCRLISQNLFYVINGLRNFEKRRCLTLLLVPFNGLAPNKR